MDARALETSPHVDRREVVETDVIRINLSPESVLDESYQHKDCKRVNDPLFHERRRVIQRHARRWIFPLDVLAMLLGTRLDSNFLRVTPITEDGSRRQFTGF